MKYSASSYCVVAVEWRRSKNVLIEILAVVCSYVRLRTNLRTYYCMYKATCKKTSRHDTTGRFWRAGGLFRPKNYAKLAIKQPAAVHVSSFHPRSHPSRSHPRSHYDEFWFLDIFPLVLQF